MIQDPLALPAPLAARVPAAQRSGFARLHRALVDALVAGSLDALLRPGPDARASAERGEAVAGGGDVARLARDLHAIAGAELELLAEACRGSRLRALAAARAVLEAALPALAIEGGQAAAPPRVARGAQPAGGRPSRTSLVAAFEAAARVDALEELVARLAPQGGWHRDKRAFEAMALANLDALERLLARTPELARVADLLGRLEADERRGRRVERGGRAAVVGVTVGGELSDALPSELALLSDPDTEDLFYARLAERRLLSFELAGDAPEGEARAARPGPVIACVDTSGSLRGRPEELAKAAVLAVARRVLATGRALAVVLFGGRGAFTTATFRPGRALDLRALGALLLTSYYGGTDLDGPLEEALTLCERAGLEGADLLVVTDGLVRIGDGCGARVDAARAAGLEVSALVVGDYVDRVASRCDRAWTITEDPAGVHLASVALSAGHHRGGG